LKATVDGLLKLKTLERYQGQLKGTP